MILRFQITAGDSRYSREFDREVELTIDNNSVSDPECIKNALKQLQNMMKTTIKGVNPVAVSKTLWEAAERARITKEVKAESATGDSDIWALKSKITDLEKEVRKRDCRLDGMIKVANPAYVVPSDDEIASELT